MKRWMFIVMLLVPLGAQSSDWAHNAINLTHAYGDGSGVKVGVLDMLTRCTHQELAGRCHNWKPVGYEGKFHVFLEKSKSQKGFLYFLGGLPPSVAGFLGYVYRKFGHF